MKYLGLTLLAAVVMSGCYSLGTNVPQEQVAMFERGRTRCATVIERLGAPTKLTARNDGSQQLVYAHTHLQFRPVHFVVGGADATQTQWTFECDRVGTLIAYESTQGQTGMAPGSGRHP